MGTGAASGAGLGADPAGGVPHRRRWRGGSLGAVLTWLPRLARELAGSHDLALVDLVGQQMRCAQQGIALASEVAAGTLPPDRARVLIAAVEHDGDARRAALITALRRSVTSPVDREDLFRLSRRVDDVLDSIRDFVREFDLFAASPQPGYAPVLAALADGVARLDAAVRQLPRAPRRSAEAAAGAKKPGVRPAYQRAVAQLLHANGPGAVPDAGALLLLGRLDLAGERLAAAADALTDGVMKRFQ